ncbi:MAG TPA: redoxin, partial [Microbacterium sp.]|nr:redoxin [Microbacterium sp.]
MNRKTRETVSTPARTRRRSPRSRTRIWVTGSAVTVGAVLVGYGIFSAIPEAAPVNMEAAAD